MTKEIKKVALVGLGAMGAMFALPVHEKIGKDFCVLVDEKRKQRYQQEGTLINGKEYDFRYVTPSEIQEPFDLIMILVKYSALSEASELIGPCVGEDTIILSLLNGIDSEEILRESFGEKRIPRSFIQGGAVKEGRNISFTSMGKIMYGYDGLSKEENRQNENIDALEEFFNRCGIPNRVSFDIVYEQWYKFMSNISMNIPSAILLAPYGVFMENQRLVALVEEICFEVIAVANRCGVPLSCNDVKRLISIFPGMQADGKSSTMQDVEAKRKTEVDMFCQTIVNLGKKHGVLTPYNRMMLDFVKIKEDMHGM